MAPSAEQIETTGETLSITGNADIDALLVQFSDSAALEAALAYVYQNLRVGLKLTTAKDKRMRFATKGTPFTRTYELSDKDIYWLARSIQGEGTKPPELAQAHLWCMFNRFMLNTTYTQNSQYWSMIQSFSQPVNPKWLIDGEYCVPGGKGWGDTPKTKQFLDKDGVPMCAPKYQKRRIAMMYGPIYKESRDLAENFALGLIAPYPKVLVNFASGKTIPVALKLQPKYPDDVVILSNAAANPSDTAFFTPIGDDARVVPDPWHVMYAAKQFQKPYAKLANDQKDVVENILKTMTVVATNTVPVDKTKNFLPNVIPQILNYITASLAAEQRSGVKKTRAETAALASSIYQSMANKKGQQGANAAATVTAAQASTTTTPSNIAKGKDGAQVGSDNTWNFA